MNWFLYLLEKTYISVYIYFCIYNLLWNILQNCRDTFKVKNSIFNYIAILATKQNEIVVKILIKEIFLNEGDIDLHAHMCVPTNTHVLVSLE